MIKAMVLVWKFLPDFGAEWQGGEETQETD